MNEIENVKIECYVVMPDHVHMIVELGNVDICAENNDICAENDRDDILNLKGRGGTLPLHGVIGRLKSYTTKQFNDLNGTVGMKLWQRGFYERIIRNENEYFRTCEYIKNNPMNYWKKHNFHKIPKNT